MASVSTRRSGRPVPGAPATSPRPPFQFPPGHPAPETRAATRLRPRPRLPPPRPPSLIPRPEDSGARRGSEMPLPADHEVATAFAERRRREGAAHGSGIRTSVSSVGSDSWVDDPITHHIISLHINKEEGGGFMLWHVVLQKRGGYYILVLPLVDPQSFKAYESLLKRSDCGSSAKENVNLSSILLNLPCITGFWYLSNY